MYMSSPTSGIQMQRPQGMLMTSSSGDSSTSASSSAVHLTLLAPTPETVPTDAIGTDLNTSHTKRKIINRPMTREEFLSAKSSQLPAHGGKSVLPIIIYTTLSNGGDLDFRELNAKYDSEIDYGYHSKAGFPETMRRIIYSCTKTDPLSARRDHLLGGLNRYLQDTGYTIAEIARLMRFTRWKKTKQ